MSFTSVFFSVVAVVATFLLGAYVFSRWVGALAAAEIQPQLKGFFGANPRVELEQSFHGEVPESEFEELLEEIRLHMGEVGRINPTLGKSLSWNSLSYQHSVGGMGRLTHVMVTPKNGKTRIRMTESPGQHTMFITMAGIAAMMAGTVAAGAALNEGIAALAPVVMAAAVGSFFGMRTAFKHYIKNRHRTLTALMHRLANHAAPPKNQPLLLQDRIAPEKVTPTT